MPRGPIWVQAASVGEVGVARTLIEGLEGEGDSLSRPVLLSSTTPAGRDAAAALRLASLRGAIHFPLDWAPIVRRVLDAVRPRAFIAVETEIWPRLMASCGRRSIPLLLVNGRISERSFRRYRRARALLREPLAAVRAACMQTEQDAERARMLGVAADRVSVTGNMKFDAADPGTPAGEVRSLLGLPGSGGPPVLVAGSTSPGEETAVLDALELAGRPDLLLVLAPRHRERFDEVAALLRARNVPFVRRSSLPAQPRGGARVVLLDTHGELAALYAAATVAFVGGSLVPRGGQNLIEPAARGVPVLFGPHVRHVAQVARLLSEAGAAFLVRDAAGLASRIGALLDDEAAREAAGSAGRAMIARHRGATARTLRLVLPHLA